MKLTRGSICPVCGKNHSEVKGNCEVNKDRTFYGGRVGFFQDKKCDCGSEYRLCIGQTASGLKVIDMIILEEAEKVVNDTNVARTDAILDEPVEVDDTNVADIEVEKPKREYHYQLDPIIEPKPQIIAEMDSAKKKLLMLTKKELHTMLRRRKIRFNKQLDTKEELADKLLLRNPTGVGLFK